MIHLSPSKVDCFFGCKRLYLYRYLYKLPAEEKKHFFIGNVAHAALEFFHKKAQGLTLVCDLDGIPGAASNEVLKETLKDCWKGVFNKYECDKKLKSGFISKEDVLSIKEMMKKYLGFLQGKKFPSVVKLEELHKIPLGNFTIWMKADRIDSCGNNTYKIVDYKTSQKPASEKDELGSVQIPTYGILVKSLFKNAETILGEYQYLRHLDSKGVHLYTVTQDLVDNAVAKYREVASELSDSDITFEKNRKYKFCRSCEYSAVCAMDECDSEIKSKEEQVKKYKRLGVDYGLQKNG
jgi:CRISPR/Cas system-associated exonuclease Cas4 (RecB family)